MKKITVLLLVVLGFLGCTKKDQIDTKEYTEDFKDAKEIALIEAIVHGDHSKVTRLAREGVNVNTSGLYESTPVAVAIQVGRIDMLKLLFELGADPNFLTPKGVSAGKRAAAHKDSEFLRVMLDAGLDPNITSSGDPIIFYAIPNNRWAQYDMLVEHGADVLNAKTINDSTVALYMAKQFEYDRLKQLIEQGADYWTPAKSGLSVIGDVANMQKRFDANPEHPAYIARIEIIEMLRERGVEIPPDIPGVDYTTK